MAVSQETLLNITAIAELIVEKRERRRFYLMESQEVMAAFRKITVSSLGPTVQEGCRKLERDWREQPG